MTIHKSLSVVAGALMLLASLGTAGVAGAATSVQIKGSDTMVHLASAWAEKFMQENSGIEVSVTGGGSGTGIAALINGTTDIATSSRLIQPSEINAAKSRGFTPHEISAGKDGIAVIVNPSNPIKSLSMDQIKKIFTGEVNNWKAFGGPNQKIVVYTRDSSSGTFQFFQEHVLNKNDYSVRARRLPSNSAIVQSVADSAGSIGYVGLGYLADAQGKAQALTVKKNDSSPAVAPSIATVSDGTYPISRDLLLYTKGEPTGAVKTFVDFMLGSEGQQIVEEMGFVKK